MGMGDRRSRILARIVQQKRHAKLDAELAVACPKVFNAHAMRKIQLIEEELEDL